MKKLLFTLLPLALLVVSCSRGELSNSSQSEINSLPESFTSENTSLEEVQSLWNETTKQNLMSVIGELIPFVQLDQNYTSVIDSDEDGYYVCIYDEATTNLLSNYGNTLSSNGYEFYAQDDSYGYDIYMYTKQKGNDQIAIQYDFYPGNEQYASGNEIYVWILTESDDGGSSDGDTGIDSGWDDITGSTSTTFPSDVISEYTQGLDIEIPSFEASSYSYYDYEGTLIIEGVVSSDLSSEYQSKCEALGLVVTEEQDEYGIYYVAVNAEETLSIVFYYYEDGTFNLEITVYGSGDDGSSGEGSGSTSQATFPSDVINEYTQGLDIEIPSFEASSYSYYDYEGTLIIEGVVSSDLSSEYQSKCEALGLVVTEEKDEYGIYYVAVNAEETLSIVFYYYEDGTFNLEITVYGSEDDTGNEQNPVIESDILDMTNNSQLTSFDDNKAVWKASKATLIITKGTSEHTVGNGSFYYNPARVYAGQVMTFSWGEGNTPSSIVITCKSNEYATVISSSSLSGCSASSNGLVVTLTNLTNNCSITLSKQSRITSIEFKYE